MEVNELTASAKAGALLSLVTYVTATAATAALLFQQAYANWKQSKDNHPEFSDPMPLPTLKGHVAADAEGWPLLSWGPDLVAPVPVYTPPGPVQQPPMTALIGVHLYDDQTTVPPTSWYQRLDGDTWPANVPVSDPRGTFIKVSYPFGSWYKKIA